MLHINKRLPRLDKETDKMTKSKIVCKAMPKNILKNAIRSIQTRIKVLNLTTDKEQSESKRRKKHRERKAHNEVQSIDSSGHGDDMVAFTQVRDSLGSCSDFPLHLAESTVSKGGVL